MTSLFQEALWSLGDLHETLGVRKPSSSTGCGGEIIPDSPITSARGSRIEAPQCHETISSSGQFCRDHHRTPCTLAELNELNHA